MAFQVSETDAQDLVQAGHWTPETYNLAKAQGNVVPDNFTMSGIPGAIAPRLEPTRADAANATEGLAGMSQPSISAGQYTLGSLPAINPTQNIPAPIAVPSAPEQIQSTQAAPTRAPSSDAIDTNKIAAFKPAQAAPNPMDQVKPMLDSYKGLQQAQQQLGAAEVGQAKAQSEGARQLSQAINQQVAAQDAEAQKQAAIKQQAEADVEASKKTWQDSNDALKQGAAINPDRFWQEKSTGQKIGLAISVMLGAIGQGLMKSGSNPAAEMLNKMIDRDIQLQKEAYENKRQQAGDAFNMYKFYMNRYDDAGKAELATKMSKLDLLKQDINAKALAAGTPIAKANADKANAQIDLQIKQLGAQMAQQIQQKAVTKEAESGQQGINVEDFQKLDEKQKEKAVKLPNGNYKVMPTVKDADEIKAGQQAIYDVRHTLDKIKKLQADYGAELFGFSHASHKADLLQTEASIQLKKLYDINGLRPSMIDVLKDLVPNATAMRQGKVTEKIKAFDQKLNDLEADMFQARSPGFSQIHQTPSE